MDSTTLLDYALFQLTPTRTRCDLVVFSGKKKEKLASGLLQPFISHLKSAQDQISRGGYSITLRPSTPETSWFTKATLERFVKFVSTPEVLERFITIEGEIIQIESSVQLNEQPNVASGAEGESNGTGNTSPGEDSKVCLQRVLETRKTVLRKEQAMAYARALVSGFEADYLEDLISFANAFGALRLREASINFLELCTKKSNDGMWMHEVAAIQACSPSELPYFGKSGIILTGEENIYNQDTMMNQNELASNSSVSRRSSDIHQDNGLPSTPQMQPTDGKLQLPTWQNHLPQYMQHFQGPGFPQMLPFPGYILPGMQVPPSYFPGNIPWSPNVDDSIQNIHHESDDSWKHKSISKSKKKYSNGIDPEEDDRNENSDLSSESDSDKYVEHKVKHSSNHRKGSSKTIVIRNINYVTSRRNGEKDGSSGDSSSEDSDFVDADSIKKQIEQAVGTLERSQNATSHKKKRDGKKRNSSKNKEGIENEDLRTPEEDIKNKNWDIFQDLLMKEAESHPVRIQEEFFATKGLGEDGSSAFNAQTEGLSKQLAPSNDSFIVTEKDIHIEDQVHLQNFGVGETVRPINRGGNMDEELVFSNRIKGMDNYSQATLSSGDTDSVIIRSQKEEDWFTCNQPDISSNRGFKVDSSIFVGDYHTTSIGDHTTETNKSDVLADDSFIVQTQLVGKTSDYQPMADIFLVSDIVGASQHKHNILEHVKSKAEAMDVNKPDDLCMVLERDVAIDQVEASWNPEMDYGNDFSLTESHKRNLDVSLINSVDLKLSQNDKGPNTRGRTTGGKAVRKETSSRSSSGNLASSKSEITSRVKKSPSVSRTTPKSKLVKEEESRKKMEELVLQRQRRIAERSAVTVCNTAASSKSVKEIRRSSSVKVEKPKHQTSTGEAEKLQKTICRSSTIDRLATARTTHKPSPTESQNNSSRKTVTRENGVVAGIEKKKNLQKVKPSDKSFMNKSNMISAESDAQVKENSIEGRPQADEVDDFRDIKELQSISSVEKNEKHVISSNDTFMNENCDHISNGRFTMPTEYQSVQSQDLTVSDEMQSVPSAFKDVTSDDIAGISTKMKSDPSPCNPLPSAASTMHENSAILAKSPVYTEISPTEISTPPPSDEVKLETHHSRKKWITGGDSPQVTKGIRKLLLFGRKS